jgi:hypothetical protein
MLNVVQWIGAGLSVAGAVWIAMNIPSSKWGFVVFLLASLILLMYAVGTHQPGLVLMQSVFAVVNVIGIKRWFRRIDPLRLPTRAECMRRSTLIRA